MNTELHPACAVWPQMSDAELDSLAADIKANGLHDPLTLTPDNKLLDGRNRMLACERAGVTPATVVYAGDPVLFSLSKNKQRRHMSVDQIALVAAALVTTTQGRPNKINSSNELFSVADAAAASGVSETAIKSANAVLREGSADEIAAIKSGAAKLRATADAVRQRNKPAAPPRSPPAHAPHPAVGQPPSASASAPTRKTITRTFEIDAGEEALWDTLSPGVQAQALADKLDALVVENNQLADRFNELTAEHANLEEDHQDLIDILTMHGLDWYAPMPAVRITYPDRAAKWYEHAQAYEAVWSKLRITGSDEALKRAHDDFYGRYYEARAAEALAAAGSASAAKKDAEPSVNPTNEIGDDGDSANMTP
jgi:uncharacterized protein YkuJ